jgi:hypothetical protein
MIKNEPKEMKKTARKKPKTVKNCQVGIEEEETQKWMG